MSSFVCTYTSSYDPGQVAALCETLSIQPLTARALIRRGLAEPDDARQFMEPEPQALFDPFDMHDMDKAVARLQRAIHNQETICIYGDYDADGICAVAILLDCFSALTDRARLYIPSRHVEGYGLNMAAVQELHAEGVDLIVTVDNGVSAFEEIALCSALGMDVIVTDHHNLPEKLPSCDAVVLPPDDACGAGVALRLARALAEDERLDRWLPLAALATVADIVPLVGDNRRVVKRGLSLIEENLGLRALLRAARNREGTVDATTLAFILAPRLNAAGRLGDAARGVSLLLAKDATTADALAAELNEANDERRRIEAEIQSQAEAMIAEGEGIYDRAILLCHAGWNIGVIGIVASRLVETQHRPVILFSESADGMLTGSGRSIGSVDLHEALAACAKHFIHFGGHAGAAGITMKRDAFADFSTDFLAFLEAHYHESAFSKIQAYDEIVKLEDLSLAAVSELQRLAPFGEGNPEPIYRLCGVKLSDLKNMGKDEKHISARACQLKASLRLVGFGFGERFSELKEEAEDWSILVRPAINSYAGMMSVELILVDAASEEKLFNDFFVRILYNGLCTGDYDYFRACAGDEGRFHDAAMRRMYIDLRVYIGTDGCTPDALLRHFDRESLCAFVVFLELGFFVFEEDTIRLVPEAGQRSLFESKVYCLLTTGNGREET